MGNQHRDHLGDVFRFSLAMKGDPVFDIVLYLLRGEVILKGCADNPRRDSVDTNIVISEFAGKRTSELGESALARPT